MGRAFPGSLSSIAPPVRDVSEIPAVGMRVAIEAHDAYVGQRFTFLEADGGLHADAFFVSDASGLWLHPRE